MYKNFVEMLINSSVDGILAFDRECRYTVWNPAMEQLSGVSEEEALGHCAFDVFPFLRETGEDQYFYKALEGESVTATDRVFIVPQTGRRGFFRAPMARFQIHLPKPVEPAELIAVVANLAERTGNGTTPKHSQHSNGGQ
jgi:PAS domain S-box-containing protein